MSKITNAIGTQAYEYVRDRISDILIDELEGQLLLTGNYDIDAEVYTERTKPIDKTEMPAVNVSLANGVYDNKHQGSRRGTYVYNIDCYTNAKTTISKAGDTTSAIKLQQLMGICMSILEDPIYKTLGFEPPYIQHTMATKMDIADTNKDDADNSGWGRIQFTVVVAEKSILIVPRLIEGYDTQIKLSTTDKGYKYTGENE